MNHPAQPAPKKPARQQPPGRPQAARSRGLVHSSLYIVMGALLVVGMGAVAEWRVQDQKLREVGRSDFEAKKNGEKPKAGTPQGNYEDPDDWMKMSSSQIPRPSDDPYGHGVSGKRSEGLSRVAMKMEDRCPAPPNIKDLLERIAGDRNGELKNQLNEAIQAADAVGTLSKAKGDGGLALRRTRVCLDIVETQQAQAKYNLMMSELAAKRYERLRDLQVARGEIKNDEAGRLQSNTNAMIALLTQVQIDQQQQKAYNDAYAARLAYLHGVQEVLSQQATQPKPGLARSAASEVASQAALRLVLGTGKEFYTD